jgi:PhzF family phenazine biosynthesis protein
MPAIPIYVADAFTPEPFRGNPAAICLLSAAAEEEWMRRVAAEMNLSETAFLVRRSGGAGGGARGAGGDSFDLRWFTPKAEIALCGHATLGSAHVLWESGAASGDSIEFHTKSGILRALRAGARIELDFPAKPAERADAPAGLLEALGCKPKEIGRNQFDYLLELPSEADVRAVEPDFEALARVEARGVIVTAHSANPKFDFVSRFFAPAVGVDEDPATGSSHCCLAPYWRRKLGKDSLVAYQASARGGVLHLRVAGDRVFLGGNAVTVWRGELLV